LIIGVLLPEDGLGAAATSFLERMKEAVSRK